MDSNWTREPSGPGTYLVRPKRGGQLDITDAMVASAQALRAEHGMRPDEPLGPVEPAMVEIAVGQTRFDTGRFGGGIYVTDGESTWEWKRVEGRGVAS